jgi:hypothetical protein
MRLRAGGLKLAGAALLATLAVAGTAQAGTIRSQTNVAGHGRSNATIAAHVQARLSTRSFHPFSLSTSSFLTSVVDGISGWPLTVSLEDDPAEWVDPFGMDTNVLGFVCVYVADPNDWCYRRVFVGPVPTHTFTSWSSGQLPTYWDAAVAIMTVTHESNHYKLFSGDEGRVNTCALQQFPSVIDTYFNIHPTITRTVAVRTTVLVKKRIWVRRHGRRVRVTRRVRSFRVVYRQQTVPNPDYVLLVQAAQQFYASQPPPYNSGTCW